ncbi:hypothetical protein SMICM17S_10573 [Streptomyces microflavus]
MLTAFSQRDLVERARDAGAMAYLVKPFSKSDVVPAIEMAVSRFAELKALESEIADLSQRLETRKLVDRAKRTSCRRHYGLSEPAAFRWHPEDVDGPADVDAAAGGGADRGRRGEEEDGRAAPYRSGRTRK